MNIWNILKFAHKGVKSYPAKLGRAGRSAFALYAALVLCVLCFAAPAFAADDPLAIVNNLSDFVFSLIRAVGVILLGWGVVQVGLSFQSLSLIHISYPAIKNTGPRQRRGPEVNIQAAAY